MFSNLANAIALEVGFKLSGRAGSLDTFEDRLQRKTFFGLEVEELRQESGLPVEQRVITAAMVAEAVAFKTEMMFAAMRASDHFSSAPAYIVYKDTPQIATCLRKSRYERMSAARNAAAKAGPGYEAIDGVCRIRRLRLRVVRNAMYGGYVLERNDTSYSLSVASEAYWQN